jgi:hypothetical protein
MLDAHAIKRSHCAARPYFFVERGTASPAGVIGVSDAAFAESGRNELRRVGATRPAAADPRSRTPPVLRLSHVEITVNAYFNSLFLVREALQRRSPSWEIDQK